MTPHQHQQLKQWAEDMRPLPGQGYLYDLMHEAIDAVVPVVPPPFYDPNEVAFKPGMIVNVTDDFWGTGSVKYTNCTVGKPEPTTAQDRIIAALTALREAVKPEPTHAEAYAALNPKVGERFKVVRKVEPEGWTGGWTADKKARIGSVWKATSVEPDHGVYLTGLLGIGIGYFPANALERVTG